MESYLPQKKKAKIFKFAPALSGNKHLRVAASFREKETTHWAGTKKGVPQRSRHTRKKFRFVAILLFHAPAYTLRSNWQSQGSCSTWAGRYSLASTQPMVL